MVEALEWAADYAERYKLFEAPLNNRGYVKDGWVEPTPEQKSEIIIRMAREIAEPVVVPEKMTLTDMGVALADIANLCPHGFALCAPCEYIPDSWKPR